MEKEQHIIAKATELFLSYGIKSLTMDDVAKALAISKKTLYHYVKDKNDLVTQCLNHQINQNECEMQAACKNSKNAIEELIGFSQVASAKMAKIQPSVFFDIQKYHHDAWDILEKFQNESILTLTKNNIQRGINEGLYRKSLNIDVIANVYLSIIQNIFRNPFELLSNVSINDFYMEIFHYHVRGIANEKGIQLLNQYLSE